MKLVCDVTMWSLQSKIKKSFSYSISYSRSLVNLWLLLVQAFSVLLRPWQRTCQQLTKKAVSFARALRQLPVTKSHWIHCMVMKTLQRVYKPSRGFIHSQSCKSFRKSSRWWWARIIVLFVCLLSCLVFCYLYFLCNLIKVSQTIADNFVLMGYCSQ